MSRNSKKVPIYAVIQHYLLDHIRNGSWQPGDKIPSENELAAQFNASRLTVKYALQDLVDDGIVIRIQGKGTYMTDKAASFSSLSIIPDTETTPQVLGHAAKPNLVAFLMPRLNTTYTAALLSGIEEEISKSGYHLIFHKTDDCQQTEKKKIKEMMQLGVKGIIVFPVDGETYNEEIVRLTYDHFPLVVVDRYLRGIDTNYVCSDNRMGTYDAVHYLHTMGHKHIGFASVRCQGTTSLEDRLLGYEQALADYKLPLERSYRYIDADSYKLDEEGIYRYLSENDQLTAVFAVNWGVGLQVIAAAERLGKQVPNDLSVVFFDDYEQSPVSRIPPTCLEQHPKELGRLAAELLTALIHKPDMPRQKTIVEPELIIRHSTGPAPLARTSN